MSAKPDTEEGATARSPRTARLVLVTPEVQLIGCLPPIPVETPYWQHILPVVESAKAHFGIDITVLRLLETEVLGSIGGQVTYLAEISSAPAFPVEPWSGELEDHPLRLPYAKPGGPASDLDWAMKFLLLQGYEVAGGPVQIRTWNLSSIWRIPVSGQDVWLKAVPPFFAHEGPLIERLAGQSVPNLIGHEHGRSLIADVPGNDLYVADLPTLMAMVELLIEIQSQWLGRAKELAKIGLPDWCGHTLQAELENLIGLRADELLPTDLSVLKRFASELPARRKEIAECGLGDTLVHGDFHPGNIRGDGTTLTLIDWGDSGVGHPLLDQSAFLEWVPEPDIPTVRAHWADLWRRAIPGSNPEHAADLTRPIATAQRAVKYQMFLDNIEPSERVYHCSDPVDWLRQTVLEL